MIYGRHTGINVRSMGAALVFYVDHLGMKIAEARTEKPGAYIDGLTGIAGTVQHWVKVETTDGYQLELVQWVLPLHLATWPNEEKYNRPGINHLCFRVSDAVGLRDRLATFGYRVGKLQLDPPGAVRNFHAHDGDGPRLCAELAFGNDLVDFVAKTRFSHRAKDG